MSCSNCCDSNDITLPEGTDGVGISSITLNGNNELVITYTDSTTTTTSPITITATSTNILHNDTTAQSETYTDGVGSALGTFSYTVPAATVTTNGSEIRATAWFSASPTAGTKIIKYFIHIDGAWYSANIPNGAYLGGDLSPHKVKMELILTRVSNTTVFVSCHFETYGNYPGGQLYSSLSSADFELTPPALGAINFTTTGIVLTPYAIYIDGLGGTQSLTCSQFKVEHYKK